MSNMLNSYFELLRECFTHLNQKSSCIQLLNHIVTILLPSVHPHKIQSPVKIPDELHDFISSLNSIESNFNS